MIIYKATNKVNGKSYIGMTSYTLEFRKRDHYNCAMRHAFHSVFHHAIRKYGFDAFTWEEIDNAMFYDDLQEKEKYWIKHYDTYNNGYNLTIGGEGVTGADRRGEKSSTALLTDQQALEIIKLLIDGEMSEKEIAEIYNVSIGIISRINSGKTYSHLYEGDCPAKAGRKPVERILKGEQIGGSILTQEQVVEIRRLLSVGLTIKEIAKIMGVKRATIVNVRCGTSWSWLKTPYDDKIPRQPKYKLTEEQVREIKRLLKQGERQWKIAELFNVAQTCISGIATGKRWKHVQ